MSESEGPEHEARKGYIWWRRQYGRYSRSKGKSAPVGAPEGSREEIEVRTFPPGVQVAKAWTSVDMRVNLGNFEHVTAAAGCSLPCVVEELDAAFNEAWRRSTEKLHAETADVKKWFGWDEDH